MTRTKPPKPLCIKIYTTKAVIREFAKRAAEQSRSVSKHGEFLVKQDLASAAHIKEA